MYYPLLARIGDRERIDSERAFNGGLLPLHHKRPGVVIMWVGVLALIDVFVAACSLSRPHSGMVFCVFLDLFFGPGKRVSA